LKAVFTVIVDNYMPELCSYTVPTIKEYAERIGAEHIIIDQRKFPDFPPTYEKMQIFELGKKFDHCILVDADMEIDMEAPDFTTGISPGYVGALEAFDASNMFVMDEFFKRDGRNIGIASNFVVTDRATHKLWEPLNMPWSEARQRTKREFIIDEYCISRNLAKYGLKFTGLNYSDQVKSLFNHIGASTK